MQSSVSATQSSSLFVQSLAKGLTLLEVFGEKPGVLSLTELADYSSLDRSTVQRMAHTLVAMGYLERGANGRGYQLGKKFLDRTFDYLRGEPLIERATPILIELQKETGERVDLSLFDDLSIVYAVRHQGKRLSFYSTLVGRRIPTYAASGGRAVMAHLPDADVDDIIARSDRRALTPKSITEPEAIWRKVREARQQRYAVAVEEALLGEIVLASAILQDGRPVGAIHIAGSRSEWDTEAFCDRFSPLAIGAAAALSV